MHFQSQYGKQSMDNVARAYENYDRSMVQIENRRRRAERVGKICYGLSVLGLVGGLFFLWGELLFRLMSQN